MAVVEARRAGLIGSVFSFLVATVVMAAPARPIVPGDLTARLADWMEAGGVPGLALAVVAEGEVAWLQGLGTADVATGRPVLEDTVFEAASLSKPVFAYAALRLVERGELDLDRPLVEYLPHPPDAEYLAADERLAEITARHVLSHSSGLPNWRGDRQLAIRFPPGSRFGYSGEGFVYLQKAVEAITGLDLEELARREVFTPLGMERSAYVWRPLYDRAAATGHDLLLEPVEKRRPEEGNAAASLHTTAGDYARFLLEMLHPSGLKPEAVAAMLTPRIAVEEGGSEVAWGLGWGLEERAGERLFWHWGDNGAFRCFTMASPGSGRAFILLTNGENGLSLAEDVADLLLPGPPHPAFPWIAYERHDSPALALRRELMRAAVEGPEAVVARYRERRAEHGAAFAENLLNRLGYNLLFRRNSEAAIAVFRLNVEEYPESANVWDSLGEAYMKHGDTARAIANYEKSLALDPDNANAAAMLEELRRGGAPAAGAEAEEAKREILVPAGWEGAYRFGYAPLVRVGDMVIVSGIPNGGEGSYEERVRRMYERAREALASAGATFADVVELTTFHLTPEDSTAFRAEFDRYMPIHREFFGEHRPAWTAVGTSALLSRTADVEMRLVAVLGSGESSRVVFERPPAQP